MIVIKTVGWSRGASAKLLSIPFSDSVVTVQKANVSDRFGSFLVITRCII